MNNGNSHVDNSAVANIMELVQYEGTDSYQQNTPPTGVAWLPSTGDNPNFLSLVCATKKRVHVHVVQVATTEN